MVHEGADLVNITPRIGLAFESALLRVAAGLQGPEVVDVLLNMSHVKPADIPLDRLFRKSRNRLDLAVWAEEFGDDQAPWSPAGIPGSPAAAAKGSFDADFGGGPLDEDSDPVRGWIP